MGTNLSGILSRKKCKGTHQTALDVALPMLKFANESDLVRNIRVGRIIPGTARQPALKLVPTRAGIRMSVKGNGSTQDIYLYCAATNISALTQAIQSAWDELHRRH
ncbi:MAG: hypothetical protein WCJ29_05850 [bacterium]